MAKSSTLLKTRYTPRKDEFYTLYQTIADEVETYPLEVWEGKSIYCPCDADWSNFTKYFTDNFARLKLKRLTCSNYTDGKMMTITKANQKQVWKEMEGDVFYNAGDFRSLQSKQLMSECDIVITNPPFSLCLDFFRQVSSFGKQYLIIIFQPQLNSRPFMSEFLKGNLSVGNTGSGVMPFQMGEGCYSTNKDNIAKVNSTWVTSLPTLPKQLPKNYIEDIESYTAQFRRFRKYPEVINVPRIKDIPTNYNGVMGVPITYMKFHNPKDYKILGQNGTNGVSLFGLETIGREKNEFGRIFIQRLPH